MSRKSPAKVEAAAREAAAKAREAAIADGATEEGAAEIAEAAAAAVRKGEEPAAPAVEAEGAGRGGEELEPEELLERVIPNEIAARIARDKRREELEPTERALLAEACYVFGINPDPTIKPRELADYRYDIGDPDAADPIPAHVSLVTSGGLKIRYPIDEDTETRLRQVYGCYRANPKTGEREVLPLPPDLTLPRQHVDGRTRSSEHVYKGGYLREGADGRERREKLDQLRRAGKIR